jgi:co-chaperonin GroES (HSP10)
MQARQKSQTGIVIAVNGDDDMKVGDRVAFPEVVGIPIELKNKTYILAKNTEIYAILEDDKQQD